MLAPHGVAHRPVTSALPPVPLRIPPLAGDRSRGISLRTGARALDAFLPPFQGGECVFIDSGHPFVFDLTFDLCAQAVGPAAGTVLYLDGGNTMDPTRFPALARRHGIKRDLLLDRIQVARAFTAYQLTALIEETLPAVLEARGDSIALVAAACFPELYLDEDVPQREAKVLAERALGILRATAARREIVVLATNYGLTKLARRPGFRPALYGAVDRVVRIEARRRTIRVRLPAEDRWVDFSPAPWAQRTLEEYGGTATATEV